MSRLLNVLVGIALLLSLAAGGVAHAAEQACIPGIETSAISHLDGDAGQAAHGGKEYAHQHGGCHGHHNVAPAENTVVLPSISSGSNVVAFESTIGASAPPGTSLRPPIA